MSENFENRSSHTIQSAKESIGDVMIADDVVAIIAGFAATETEGVASMAGNITKELVSKLGMKNLSRGVKVEMTDKVVRADISINIEYGCSIPKVCAAVQDKVKSAIENMTGLVVSEVHVKVAGVNVDNAQ